jgi:hypothetical protein
LEDTIEDFDLEQNRERVQIRPYDANAFLPSKEPDLGPMRELGAVDEEGWPPIFHGHVQAKDIWNSISPFAAKRRL